MSWIKSAMQKAVELPGGVIKAAVRTYTENVIHHAGNSVADAAKMFHVDRFVTQKIQSFSDAATSLEEVSVSCKGEERVELLRSWLVALREFERVDENYVENDRKSLEDPRTLTDKNVTPGNSATMILYYDSDLGSVPMKFRDVFLQSQALEGMTMSMILQEPNEEEIFLLREIFRLCLTRGKGVHDVLVEKIHDLAKTFSVYGDEMLVKKDQLLQFAQTAITGLKETADVASLDSEISQIQQSLNGMKCQRSVITGHVDSSESATNASSKVILLFLWKLLFNRIFGSIKVLIIKFWKKKKREDKQLILMQETEEYVAQIQLCCRLKSLLLQKRLLTKGDTPETHTKKVDKLKLLYESLHNSAYKTEKRISEHRVQKEEIVIFREARTGELSQIEKDLEAEIRVIEKKRDKLEAELREVNNTLAAANARLQDAREERLQFDQDNNEFLLNSNEKEDELSKTIISYKAEADTCSAFINFLEATWAFQSSFAKQKDKQVNDQLQTHEAYFVNATIRFLSTYKEQLEPTVDNLRKLIKGLKGYRYVIDPDEEFLQDIEQREDLEQEYLDAEAKVIKIFDAVESIKELFYSAIDDTSRKGVEMVNELCDDIEKIKCDFKTIRRPILRIEIPTDEEFSTATGSPQAVGTPSSSSGRVMQDLTSVFSQKLLIKFPRQKPYIPLGGSPENSPFSPMENDTKSAENSPLSTMEDDFKSAEYKQHKLEVLESEKPSQFDKYLSDVALKVENKTIKMMSSGHHNEGSEQLTVPVTQERKMQPQGTLDDETELVESVLNQEIGMNTETQKVDME
ncbi:uncharacterized protein [Rutidosis leptorrhynchoides]|uniref:uncharacterized protein n=1 Tax=Rutidosis leptorrhynchoides TaxID=125765 RepID=UPI003A9A49C6